MPGTIRFVVAILAAVVLTSAASTSIAAETITIAGDPCSVPLISKLAEAYSHKSSGFTAEVSTHSCTRGVFMASSGEVDVGVSTQNGLKANLPRGGVNTVIAASPIVLVVNKDNPVDGLTYAQVRGIYAGEITNWSEVGGRDAEIENVMLQPCVMHTISKQVVPYAAGLNKISPGRKVNPVTHTNVMVAENPAAIGQQIYGYETDDVKVLRIDGLLPSPNTLPDRYTFYQDYNVVTHGEPAGEVRGFVDFAFTDEGRRVVRAMRHVPARR